MNHSTGDGTSGSWALGTEEDLRQRMSLVTPGDTTRGLFLNSVLEAVRLLGGEPAVRHCLAEGGETRFLELFNYPIGTLLRMSYAGARLLSDETRSFAEVMRQMGYVSARNFTSSRLGAVLLRTVLSDPRRLLETMPTAYRMTKSSGECTVRFTGFNTAFLRITRDFLPTPYTEGTLQGSFEAARVRGLTVRVHSLALLDTDYELTWG